MPVITGTYTTYPMKGIRENLLDVITNISPRETPFVSGIGVGDAATHTLVEWQVDSLAAADGTNAQLEGDDPTYTTPAATVRVGNYTQILYKTAIISDTAQTVRKAGRPDEMAYQIAKRGLELRRDLEAVCLRAQGGNAGALGTPRTLASMLAWVKTNTDMGTGGANPSWSSGVPGAARTDGTQRNFTETIAKNVLQLGWTNGARFSALMVGPVNRTRVSTTFTGIVTRNYDISNTDPRPTAAIASVDVYVSDYHVVRIIPNRFQRERDAWFIDWDLAHLSYLRPPAAKPLAKTGDAEKRLLVMEVTLVVLNEAGFGLAADLTTT